MNESPNMPQDVEWEIPGEIQPKPGDCDFDLDRALGAVLGLRATVPEDAFTAGTLGTERAGSGVLIRGDGLVLTIGYLVTEAETIWLTSAGGGAVPGHVLAYDQETGFGLVQALGRLNVAPLELGVGMRVGAGDRAIMAAEGGRRHAISPRGRRPPGIRRLLGIRARPRDLYRAGASVLGRCRADRRRRQADRHRLPARPAFERPRTAPRRQHGRADRPVAADPRRHADLWPAQPPGPPWLGLYAAEVEDAIVVAGLAERGPASKAGLQPGDRIVAVRDEPVASLAGFWRRVWAGGPAGSEVVLQVARDGETMTVRVQSADRTRFLKAPKLQR